MGGLEQRFVGTSSRRRKQQPIENWSMNRSGKLLSRESPLSQAQVYDLTQGTKGFE